MLSKKKQREREIIEEGRQAARAGTPYESCPYKLKMWGKAANAQSDWRMGYLHEQQTILEDCYAIAFELAVKVADFFDRKFDADQELIAELARAVRDSDVAGGRGDSLNDLATRLLEIEKQFPDAQEVLPETFASLRMRFSNGSSN